MGFEQLGLHEAITSTLVGLKYDEPTAVQQQVIPEALSGNDVLAGAQTGTGKTAAFVLPIIHRLLQNPRSTSSAVNVVRSYSRRHGSWQYRYLKVCRPIAKIRLFNPPLFTVA